jgi:hypothetical protein
VQVSRVGYVFSASLLFASMLFSAVAAIVPAAALARTTRVYEGSLGSFEGKGPKALAIDRSTGDIYAFIRLNETEGAVSRFTAAGAPDNFTAGPSSGTNTLTGFSAVGTVAIDRSGGSLNGDIYVTDQLDNTVRIFANNGIPLGALDGSGTHEGAFLSPCGVAVDQSNGDLYVAQDNGAGSLGKIWRYGLKSSAGSIKDADFTVTGISADRVCDVAADSGKVYAAAKSAGGDGKLYRYAASSFVTDPPGKNLGTVLDSGPVTAVYVDPQNGDVYADEGNRVSVFDSGGARMYDFGFAADFGVGSEGVAVKSAASGAAAKAYVADSHPGGEQIDVFGPPGNVPLLSYPERAAFGKDGTAATSFDSGLDQLAFDQAARRLFALDRELPGVYGFDASAPPAYPALGGFAPLATAAMGGSPGLAVDSSGLAAAGNVYLASQGSNLLYGFDSAGAALAGGFPIDPAAAPGAPGGSPAELCGAAVDSAGDIWIADKSGKRILEYSSAGALLPGSIDTSAQGGPCRLAFDSSDNLYAVVDGGVWRYNAAGGYSTATLVDSSTAFGIAVDPSSDHLYVAHENWVDEYNSAAGFVDEFATGISGASFRGIAVDAANHDLYLADAGNQRIRVLGPGVILPEVAIGSASGATNTTSTLHGSVALQGLALTDCRFEYVSEAAYRVGGFGDLSSGGSVPCAPAFGSIPADLAPHPVSVFIEGLTTSTTYRFRLLAANANANASSISSEARFTTAGRPIVETTGAPIRTTTTAAGSARVVPPPPTTSSMARRGRATRTPARGPPPSLPARATSPSSSPKKSKGSIPAPPTTIASSPTTATPMAQLSART